MKIYNLALLLNAGLLISCSQRTQWAHEKIHASYHAFSHSKVYYHSPDSVHGVDLEFIPTKDFPVKGYLFIHSTPLTLNKITVCLTIEGEEMQGEAFTLQGGQRFLLSDATVLCLLEAFAAEKKVDIAIPGYHSTISGKGFTEQFRSLKRSFMKNPFHLPF